jgi:hypothetical protein
VLRSASRVGDDLVVLADRFDTGAGWSEDSAESCLLSVRGSIVTPLHRQVGWLTAVHLCRDGRLFSSQGGARRTGILMGGLEIASSSWTFASLPEPMLGVGGAGSVVLAWSESHAYRFGARGFARVRGPKAVIAVHGLDADTCYAVGKGFIARFASGGLHVIARPAAGRLVDVFVAAADEIWAVGDRRLLRGSGSRWTTTNDDAGAARSCVRWRGRVWLAAEHHGLVRRERGRLSVLAVRFAPRQLLAGKTLIAVCEDRLAETSDGRRWRELPAATFVRALAKHRPLWWR